MAAAQLNSANQTKIRILVSNGFWAVQSWRAIPQIAQITKIVLLVSFVIGGDAAFVALTCHAINRA